MKQLLLIMSILCLGATESWSENNDPQIPIQVIISSDMPRPNRNLDYVPIQAYYEESLSLVCFSFAYSLGDLELTITNNTDGSYVEYEVDSSLGSAILPISGTSGIYYILIETSAGVQYYGEFEI